MVRTKRQQLAIVSNIKSTLESIASYEMSMAFKKDQRSDMYSPCTIEADGGLAKYSHIEKNR